MTYKRKVAVLSLVIVVLSAIYILSLVLDPENRKGAAFAWLDSSLLILADGVEIYGPGGRIALKRRNDAWFYQAGRSDYQPNENTAFDQSLLEFPVKQERVRDLFALLAKREVYPVRASSPEGIEKLKVTEEYASRIIVRGGAGLPLLDLLIGSPDALGRDVHLRRTGWNQIYSAEDNFSFFTESMPRSWYDLRLFPQIATGSVQQVEISHTDMGSYILRRGGGRWIIPGKENASVDTVRVESWLRLILEAEGDDFGLYAPEEIEGTISIWFGDGTNRTIQVGPIDEDKNRRASISGSSFFYVFSERTFFAFFRSDSYFFD